MRYVTYTDDKGYQHQTLIKDDDPDSMAKYGIPKDPPNVELLDMDGLKRDLHNTMVKFEVFTQQDVMTQANGLAPLVSVFKRYLYALYEQEELSKKQQ
jgi:hypothetical protein